MAKIDWNTKLIEGAGAGSLENVKKALAKGADIHSYGDGALHWGIASKSLEVVKYLIENGAVSSEALRSEALRLAKSTSLPDVAALLETKESVSNDLIASAESGDIGFALYWAKESGYTKVVALLETA